MIMHNNPYANPYANSYVILLDPYANPECISLDPHVLLTLRTRISARGPQMADPCVRRTLLQKATTNNLGLYDRCDL